MTCDFQQATAHIPDGQWTTVDVTDKDTGKRIQTHVIPTGDSDGHQAGLTCHCEPTVEYQDPDDGYTYDHPLIIYNAFDGRQAVEEAKQILQA